MCMNVAGEFIWSDEAHPPKRTLPWTGQKRREEGTLVVVTATQNNGAPKIIAEQQQLCFGHCGRRRRCCHRARIVLGLR